MVIANHKSQTIPHSKKRNVVGIRCFFCCFSCMNEQLKCIEMLLRDFLYFLEHCTAPRGPVYILEVIMNKICN